MNPMKTLVARGPVSPLGPSERDVLAIILRSGPIARSALTEKTQLTQQSVHRIIDSLEGRGYLQFGEARIVGRGKPSPTVSINPTQYASIGISISTENVRFCLLDLVGNPIVEETVNIASSAPKNVIKALRNRVRDWRSSGLLGRTLLGVGIAMQGFRAGTRDLFYPPEPLRAWQDIQVETVFSEELGLPAFAENNATSSAVAEHYLGDGIGQDCIVYLSFNYGFGSGIFWESKPFRGGHGNAGEISTIFSDEEMPHRPALGQLIKRLVANGIDIKSVLDLGTRFEPDWPGVAEWLEDVKPQLHRALRALQATIDPNAIFFGGEAPEALRQMLVDLSRGAFTDKRIPVPALLSSRLPGDPAHFGAALLPLHQLVF